ncbi:cell division ATP-binding protein FtsE [Parasporobacterium paucivorans]|uniref:Cell division transport system ATP-binding protein n=1 Tax=Parasporobacterium paucivorans DSM 15970 TaxID=1122934 RepID=A0A1M6I5V4_9FIRM|nr:ATP-binding cassette domain-containing protein [Parasporobacterium paucivorans]SHJ29819.1 cell division transport system ATP-binding protein [Parasporobacterium paucivorans DSM 15970]
MSDIKFDQVTKVYNKDVTGVDNLSFFVETGEFVFLVGKSGAGKSTLLRLLTAQEEPTSGEIHIGKECLGKISRSRIPYIRRGFGIMEKGLGLLEDRDIRENLEFAMIAAEQPRRGMADRIDELLGVVGLRRMQKQFPQELSGGEAARALLARSLIANPRIIVADEPTANLDPDSSWDLMCLLSDISRQGITVMVACHDRELVDILKKRVITLADGRIIGDEKKGRYNSRMM